MFGFEQQKQLKLNSKSVPNFQGFFPPKISTVQSTPKITGEQDNSMSQSQLSTWSTECGT